MQSQPLLNNQPKRRFPFARLLSLIFVVSIGIFVWFNQQYIFDSVRFWQYEPLSSIAAMNSRMELTDSGTFMFYSAQPSLDDPQVFNTKCPKREEGTAILGCYDGSRMYLFNVTDERLDGIEEVTAAHEMLHAVYQRLSSSERNTINQLIEVEYEKLKEDPSLTDRMAFYARTEPGERDNELHSIIGTEVASIGNELEAHYSKYFAKRQTIVTLHTTYNRLFLELEEQKKTLSTQLDTLGKEREAMMREYEAAMEALNADIAQFNRRASGDYFSSQAQFNSQRSALMTRADRLEALRTEITQAVATYNNLVKQYNDSVLQSGELYKSIDSSVAPAPTV